MDHHILVLITLTNINPPTKFQNASIIETLRFTFYKTVTLQIWPKSVDHDVWTIIPSFLYIPVVVTDIKPHTKFFKLLQ